MYRFFTSLYYYFRERKILVFGLVISLFVVCGYLATKIRLVEDIASFMPDTPRTEHTNFVLRNLSTNDKIVLKLAAADSSVADPRDFLISCSDSLADSLRANPGDGYVKEIFYKIDDSKISDTYDFIFSNLPLFLKEKDYCRLDSITKPDILQATLEQDKKDLVSPVGLIFKKYLISDPLHISNRVFADLKLNTVDSLYSVYNGYIFSKDNKNLLIFITSVYSVGETGKNGVLADALEHNIKSLTERNKGKLSITSFGAAIVGVSNARQIKKDSYLSSAISIILIVLLLGIFFRSFRSLLLLLVPVVFGVAFSLSFLYIIKGTVSAIAIGAGSAILGIAINYTLHFLVHYKHSKSIELTIKDLVSPLVVGSITTIGAFLSLLFVSAGALRDFGVFAAIALTGTILFVLIFLPHFLKPETGKSSHYPVIFDRVSEVKFDKNRWVVLGILILTIVFGYFSFKLTFESDMNKISYMTDEQKKALSELSNFTNLAQKSVIHVSEGQNSDQALRNCERAKLRIDSLIRTGDIMSVAGPGEMLMSDSLQKMKISRWNNYWKGKSESFRRSFDEKSVSVGFRPNSFTTFYKLLDNTYSIKNIDELLVGAAYASGYIIEKPGRTCIISLLYIPPQKEEMVKKILSTVPGTFIFDRASATKATINVLSYDFNFVLFVCALLVMVFISLSFGRFELSLLTFIPMVIGWFWILGLMAILDLKFNIVNIILATFIFGLGDDYSIFIMEGSMNENAYKRKILDSYKLAVILSALTMFIGIGSLIFARHPAMKSLAQVTIIGMVSVVVISYTIVPFLYSWLTYKNGEKRIMPITARNLFNSAYSFTAFLIGSLFHSILGFCMFRLTRSNDRKKLFFHKSLAFTAGFVVKRIPGVKTQVINRSNEDFRKPSIIICNHQSHIDLMLIMMLSPRIVILTNEWVWNSPFYGSIVKYADFYPVLNGIENSIDHLSALIEKGYSIMIFPEGTRSADCSINRFHRGAFYLAEHLKLDIVPVMIHGMGHVLPKTDFLLREGSVSVEILDRIPPEDNSYGETYTERAKYIRRMYKSHYLEMAHFFEKPAYFEDKVIHNYIYKGTAVYAQVRADLDKHSCYSAIIEKLPCSGKILVPGAGYGSFTMMTSMVRPDLMIDAVDDDPDRLELAANCASSSRNVKYYFEDPVAFKPAEDYDCVVLIDWLSQHDPDVQYEILHKCLEHSPVILLTDIEYSGWSKVRQKFAGLELQKIRNINISDLKQLAGKQNWEIIQTGNILSISRQT